MLDAPYLQWSRAEPKPTCLMRNAEKVRVALPCRRYVHCPGLWRCEIGSGRSVRMILRGVSAKREASWGECSGLSLDMERDLNWDLDSDLDLDLNLDLDSDLDLDLDLDLGLDLEFDWHWHRTGRCWYRPMNSEGHERPTLLPRKPVPPRARVHSLRPVRETQTDHEPPEYLLLRSERGDVVRDRPDEGELREADEEEACGCERVTRGSGGVSRESMVFGLGIGMVARVVGAVSRCAARLLDTTLNTQPGTREPILYARPSTLGTARAA